MYSISYSLHEALIWERIKMAIISGVFCFVLMPSSNILCTICCIVYFYPQVTNLFHKRNTFKIMDDFSS